MLNSNNNGLYLQIHFLILLNNLKLARRTLLVHVGTQSHRLVKKPYASKFMPVLSEKCKLSKWYTNHSIHATAATILSHQSFNPAMKRLVCGKLLEIIWIMLKTLNKVPVVLPAVTIIFLTANSEDLLPEEMVTLTSFKLPVALTNCSMNNSTIAINKVWRTFFWSSSDYKTYTLFTNYNSFDVLKTFSFRFCEYEVKIINSLFTLKIDRCLSKHLFLLGGEETSN